MKKILFCLLLLPTILTAQRLTVDSVLLKKQGSIPAKWVSVNSFGAVDTINEIQTLYNHNLYDLKRIDTTTRTKVLTRKATDSLINYALTGTVDTKGNWDASGNTLPSASVKTGDKWTISVKGFVSPDSFYVGDVIIAKIDDPGQTVTNWNHIYASQPKSVNLVLAGSSQVGALKYNGLTQLAGAMDGGTVLPMHNTPLNIDADVNVHAFRVGRYLYKGVSISTDGATIINNELFKINNSVNSGNKYIYFNTGASTGSQFVKGLIGGTYPFWEIYNSPSSGACHRLYATNGYSPIVSFLTDGGVEKATFNADGYLFNIKPTFSSVFFDSTRVIELNVNTPKIISNAWGNLWPNSVLVGFTENKDTAIVGYTGNYNMTFDFNCNVSVTASFRYHVKKRPANSTSVTTIYRKEVSNSGTTVNRAMSLNWNFTAGDRVWIEVENITNGTDVTVYGGAFAITANYLNP